MGSDWVTLAINGHVITLLLNEVTTEYIHVIRLYIDLKLEFLAIRE